MLKNALISICIIPYLLTAAGCMTMQTPAPHQTTARGTLAHQYGEEILAYMMQVVLGKAGDPDSREKWKTRGLDKPLDLELISGIMSDPGSNKSAIMVHDPNILGLSKVLYHYAPEMSQFSGSYGTSLYPATELIALRLFLLKRLRDDRKVSIPALLAHRQLLLDPERPPSREELAAMKLTPEEFLLLQTAFGAKPWLFHSLNNPFLVAAFDQAGVLTKEPLTEKIISNARYPVTACASPGNPPGRESAIIAFLPSITKEFTPTDSRFMPSETYTAAIETLKAGIVAECRRIALQTLLKQASYPAGSKTETVEKQLDRLIARRVFFQTPGHRPLVIYPENAAKVVRETCPRADFAVIILGRNVYQAMHIDHATDIYPKVKRVFLDITDVKYNQVASEVSEIGRFLFERIKPWLSAAVSERKVS